MAEERQREIATAQAVLSIQRAYRDGKLQVMEGTQDALVEIMAAPKTPFGSIDVASMSPQAKATARAINSAMKQLAEPAAQQAQPADMLSVQRELFRIFEKMFAGLVGHPYQRLANEDEIKPLMLQRMENQPAKLELEANSASEELGAFYSQNAMSIFQYAKSIGGMKLVTGGQRAFGPSALTGVRLTGLYADTQLVPDPVYPFLTGGIKLNAQPLQLAIVLFHTLALLPLVNANVTQPPVFLFPSFEEQLDDCDAHTIRGQEELALLVLGPACNGTVASVQDVVEFAVKHETEFVTSVLEKRLFVPPGFSPTVQLTADQAVRGYIEGIRGYRKAEDVAELEKIPTGILLLNGVLERIRPQYHLLENASEFNAQPLLNQATHWHYFETCANASAVELVRKDVLSDQSYQTLRAVQDGSLSWLANIPVAALATLIEANEHRWLRDEFSKFTGQLVAAKAGTLDATVREVRHGLDSIVQRQKKTMLDIEKKYESKKWQAMAGTGTTLAVVGVAAMLPMLAPVLGVAAPVAAAAAAIALGGKTWVQEKTGEIVEKRQVRKSVIGILATAHNKAKGIK